MASRSCRSSPGCGQRLPDQGQYPPDVVSGGKFRHNTAILAMHFRLRVKRVAQQAVAGVINRDAGFVAGGFNAKY